ncbi:Protein sidekick [Gryllus bimaculatus]|nr:Protein sidekick [Gryllus bimaculatus]
MPDAEAGGACPQRRRGGRRRRRRGRGRGRRRTRGRARRRAPTSSTEVRGPASGHAVTASGCWRRTRWRREPSAPLLVRTEGESPGAAAPAAHRRRHRRRPAARHVDAPAAPPLERPGRQPGYTFTTVTDRGGASTLALLSGLQKYRKYGVVVQAFNEKGSGPMSNEVVAQTQEDVPSAPPVDIKCSAQGPQSVTLSWHPPPPIYQNGVIVGYKVYYENTNEWPPGVIEADTKTTPEPGTDLHGLRKFANYSVQVWAYTRIGDGVKSSPIFCLTNEDDIDGVGATHDWNNLPHPLTTFTIIIIIAITQGFSDFSHDSEKSFFYYSSFWRVVYQIYKECYNVRENEDEEERELEEEEERIVVSER